MRGSDQCSSYHVTIFAAMHLFPSRLNSIVSGAIVSRPEGTFSGFFLTWIYQLTWVMEANFFFMK